MQTAWRLLAVPIAVATMSTACSDVAGEQTISPADFVAYHQADAKSVVAAVESVVKSVDVLAGAPGGIDNPAISVAFDTNLDSAQSTFKKVENTLLDAVKPRGVESSETELWSATRELSKALDSLRAYVDDRKPSELVEYKKHWDQGRAWWNQAINSIWQAANYLSSPTIPNAPEAPPTTP